MLTPRQLWQEYIKGENNDGAVPDSWYFCDNETCANELLALVLAGQKVATACLVWILELNHEPIPTPGTKSIITDWAGNAKCIINTTQVNIVPFIKVNQDFARLEGEGDASLDYWRTIHWDYFGMELARFAIKPHQNMPVVCETFEVLYTPQK